MVHFRLLVFSPENKLILLTCYLVSIFPISNLLGVGVLGSSLDDQTSQKAAFRDLTQAARYALTTPIINRHHNRKETLGACPRSGG